MNVKQRIFIPEQEYTTLLTGITAIFDGVVEAYRQAFKILFFISNFTLV